MKHVQATDKDFENVEIKEARNAAFAAAVASGGTDPLSKAAFVIYACTFLYLPFAAVLD